jgi:hypothetical protein
MNPVIINPVIPIVIHPVPFPPNKAHGKEGKEEAGVISTIIRIDHDDLSVWVVGIFLFADVSLRVDDDCLNGRGGGNTTISIWNHDLAIGLQ